MTEASGRDIVLRGLVLLGAAVGLLTEIFSLFHGLRRVPVLGARIIVLPAIAFISGRRKPPNGFDLRNLLFQPGDAAAACRIFHAVHVRALGRGPFREPGPVPRFHGQRDRRVAGCPSARPWPQRLYISPDGSQLCVSYPFQNAIDLFDTLTNTTVTSRGANAPSGIAFNAAGTRAYVACGTGSGTVIAFETAAFSYGAFRIWRDRMFDVTPELLPWVVVCAIGVAALVLAYARAPKIPLAGVRGSVESAV